MAQLYNFLVEAELQQYYTQLTMRLNVTSVGQIKQAADEDLAEIGMSKPEIRRLKKFLKKHLQQGTFNKIKRILSKGQDDMKPYSSEGGTTSIRASIIGGVQQMTCPNIERASITLNCELGSGEFGTVHYGVWKMDDGSKTQVAVKTVKKSALKETTGKFLNEISRLVRLDQLHITRLYGVVMDDQGLLVVTELAPMKSLVDCLRDPGSKAQFPVTLLCDLAVQIANGMSYLESRNFVHRDLAARNVLVFSKDMVKICDHGLTRAMGVGLDYYQTNVSISLKLPVAWCAPECITDGEFTSASDVWSYGVTLWEMFSYGFQPWAGFTGIQIAQAIGEGQGQRLNQPERCPRDVYDVMLECWNHRPGDRPQFAQLVEKMKLVKATRHIVCRQYTSTRPDCFSYSVGNIITLLDKSNCPISAFWKGIHECSNKVGFFSSADTLPYVEPKSSVMISRGKINRKESDRKSLRPGQRLHAGMISGPQNDLRHMGHVGHDGVMFGNVSCLDQNQDKMPAADTRADDVSGSSLSLPVSIHSSLLKSCSYSSLVSDGMSAVTSIISSDTLTDVSSMQEDFESLPKTPSDEAFDVYQDSSVEDLEAFRIPDISSTFDLDPKALLDEAMKVYKMKSRQEDDRKETIDMPFEGAMSSAPKLTEDKREIGPVKRSMPLDRGSTQRSDQRRNGKEEVAPAPQLISRSKEADKIYEMDRLHITNGASFDSEENISQLQTRRHLDDGLFGGLAAVESNLSDSELPKTDSRLAYCPPKVNGRVELDAKQTVTTGSALNLSESRGSFRNGMFSRFNTALTKRTGNREQKFIHSLDLQSSKVPSVSSSSELLPGIRKLSCSSSGSLPTRSGPFASQNSAAPAAHDDEAGTNVVHRRLRPGNSFNKTKEKIRSSVVSVIRSRGVVKNAQPQQPPPPNLNVNLLFFDRLREQEMENEQLEMQNSLHVDSANEVAETEKKQYNSDKNDSNQRIDPSSESSTVSADALESLRRPSSLPDSGLAMCSPRQQGSNTVTDSCGDRCSSVLSQDSLHSSECSSLTHHSLDSNLTDDSRATSPVGCIHPKSSQPESHWQASTQFPKQSRIEPVKVVNVKVADSQICAKSTTFGDSELIPSDQSQTSKMFDGLRPSQDEEISTRIQLVSSLVQGVDVEECMYALSDSNWDVTSAVQRLKLQKLVSAKLDNFEHCRKALIMCNWDLDAAIGYLVTHPSGQESPELVHV